MSSMAGAVAMANWKAVGIKSREVMLSVVDRYDAGVIMVMGEDAHPR
jgi:hypothetical protein